MLGVWCVVLRLCWMFCVSVVWLLCLLFIVTIAYLFVIVFCLLLFGCMIDVAYVCFVVDAVLVGLFALCVLLRLCEVVLRLIEFSLLLLVFVW